MMASATPFNRPAAPKSHAERGLAVLAEMFAYYEPQPLPASALEPQPEYDLVA
ncbi:hypothetical protein [Paracoccus suum]|uniref:hypothetical protein n=1 Tax=Paracoccus suum TaxID=2259340 RepID=UPI0013B05CD6|nr:hypothetical protein [Paracoccus suum]